MRRYYQETTNAPPAHLNGRIPAEQPLKYVERVTPRGLPSSFRIVVMPVGLAFILATITAYALVDVWKEAAGWGAAFAIFVGGWRLLVYDSNSWNAVDIREYQDTPAAQPTTTSYRPIMTTGRPNNNQTKIGRLNYTHAAWRKWAEIMRDNDWEITRAILNQVRLDDRCIFTNLSDNYNDLVGEMHRLGWTNEAKSKLSPQGITYFSDWIDPPTPA